MSEADSAGPEGARPTAFRGRGSPGARGRGPTPAELQVWRLFLEAHARAVAALDRDLAAASCELDLREYDLLVALAAAGDAGVRLRDLADRLLINRSNVTRRVDALAARGLVERRPDREDGRGVFAAMTPAGTRALRRAATVHLPGIKRLAFPEPVPDLDTVRRFLEAIVFTSGAEAPRTS